MKEAKFISTNKEKWAQMEQGRRLDADRLAANFVELSDDLAYARTFYPGSDVERYLNRLVASYLTDINVGRVPHTKKWWTFWVADFPLLLFEKRKTLRFALAFFLLSVLVGVFSAAREDSFVRLILGDGYVNMTLENIAAGTPMKVYDGRNALNMFLSITYNNIEVAFIAFAWGLLFSAGTLRVLFQNGIMVGAFQYFFYQKGLLLHSALSIWAHGTFEITSIVIAGGAGLVLGNSFLFPGTYPRLQSFRIGALQGIKILVGLIPFFILAGWIEGFITRYADTMPVVGLIAMLVSIVGVIGYFVVYPGYLARNRNLKTESAETPVLSNFE